MAIITDNKPRYRWYCVETPSVFLEIKLPEFEEDFTEADKRRYAKLANLADDYGVNITVTSYRRG